MRSLGVGLGPLVLAAALAVAPAARACGYHDASKLNLGMLNLAYPDALFVRTAVWMAQRDDVISPAPAPAAGDTAKPEQTAMYRLFGTVAALGLAHGWYNGVAMAVAGFPATGLLGTAGAVFVVAALGLRPGGDAAAVVDAHRRARGRQLDRRQRPVAAGLVAQRTGVSCQDRKRRTCRLSDPGQCLCA